MSASACYLSWLITPLRQRGIMNRNLNEIAGDFNMQILHIRQNGQTVSSITADALPQILAAANDEWIWLDLTAADDGTSHEKLLRDVFHFHPLAVDDALHEIHVPKLDDWGTYLYIVLQDMAYDPAENRLIVPELDVFLGKRYLVTYHSEPITAVDRVWHTCQQNHRWLQHGPDHVLYRLIDEIVNNTTTAIETIEDDLEEVEDAIFASPTPSGTPELLFDLKRIVLRLRRVLAPQREVVNKLVRNDYTMIGPKDRLFFRDVYDHMIRLYDLSDNLRDLVTGTMDTYLSVVNNRMNDVMKTLTIITTLFMPLTFLTGFFGMNYFQATIPLPAWTGTAAFLATLFTMALLPLIMFWWIRRRGWL